MKTMSVSQVRLPEGLVKEMDRLVVKGFYANKSDVLRDALRRLVLEKQIGSVANKRNSVSEVRKIREKLSKEELDLDEINRFGQ
jgi:Arc/MetJ-type ribon-helix-helix transcriptional regulator